MTTLRKEDKTLADYCLGTTEANDYLRVTPTVLVSLEGLLRHMGPRTEVLGTGAAYWAWVVVRARVQLLRREHVRNVIKSTWPEYPCGTI